MAIFHYSIKIIARGKGRSAVAAAAYRAGENIYCEYDGKTNDYTSKSGIVYKEILLPENAPAEYADRAVLWNAVEKIEKAKNSQLAREIELALPVELSREQNISLVREYVKQNFVDKGMCADICVHDKNDGNPHAHIMLTMRPFNEDKTWSDKQKKEYILDKDGNKIYDKNKRQYKCKSVPTTDWNNKTKAEEWRTAWANIVNRHLEKSNHTERIDHRSYEHQGVDQIPTVHLGAAASQMEKRGIRTERGDMNRNIENINKELRQVRERIRKAKDWLYSQPIENAPTFVSIMSSIADSKNLNSRWQKIASLKTQAKILMFLQNNNITDMTHLVDKVTKMNEDFYDVSETIKKVNRRLENLSQHLEQYGNYKVNKPTYDKYKQLDPKKQEAFYNKHSDEIELFKTSQQYLTAIMNGKTTIPEKSWQKEQKNLTKHRFSLYEKFYGLKDEIRNVELLRKGAENIMNDDKQEQRHTRTQGLEF